MHPTPSSENPRPAGTGAPRAPRGRLLAVAVLLALCAAGPARAGATFVRQWGGGGSGNGRFQGTHAVGFSPLFRIYVADEASHRIQYFGMDGAYLGQWGAWGHGDNEIINPVCLAFQADGTVYVVERDNNRIHYFTPGGTHLGKWGTSGTGPGQFNLPSAAAFAPNGDLYVTDRMNHRVQYFGPTGAYRGSFGSYGGAAGQFREPYGVAVSAAGVVYVSDSQNCRVQYFTAAGAYLGAWGSVGSGDGQFGNTSIYNNGPGHVTIDRDGFITVADPNNNRLQVFRPDGQFAGKYGGYGTGGGLFYFPNGVACAPGWQVYVADEGNNLIQQVTWRTEAQPTIRVTAIQRTPAGVSVEVEALPDRTNGVERSGDLVHWETVETAPRLNGLFQVQDAAPTGPGPVFYRGVRAP
ncbi:MAG: hypothetical protein U1F87_18510 [Kiritimatiellia bacterium]